MIGPKLYPHPHPLTMEKQPMASFHPKTSTFMPHTGQGWAGQAHPYNDTNVKQKQEMRDVQSPWRAFPLESLNT